MSNLKKTAGAVLLVFALAWPALADTTKLMQLIGMLKDNGSITAEQYDLLLAASEAPAQEAEPAGASDVHVRTKGGVSLATYDGEFSAEIGGRLQLDAAYHNEDKNALGDGTEIRRLYLDLEGTLFQDWGYELGIGFEESGDKDVDGDIDIKNAFVTYTGLWPATIRIGHQKEPFSLEALTSSTHITFMERGLVNELTPGRNVGISAQSNGESWHLAGGLFGEDWNDDPGNEGDEGWGATSRAVFAPIQEDGKLVHLGAAVSYRVPEQDHKAEVQFKTGPESSITGVDYLNTDDIDKVENLVKYGLEGAWVMGPFSMQGEYINVAVNREAGNESPDFDGWYVSGSWFLTGESRDYKISKGTFGQVDPNGDLGAVELVARYSTLDLNASGITGGEQNTVTLGVNWYINDKVRLSANYNMIDGDNDANDDGDVTGNDDPEILQLRLQVAF